MNVRPWVFEDCLSRYVAMLLLLAPYVSQAQTPAGPPPMMDRMRFTTPDAPPQRYRGEMEVSSYHAIGSPLNFGGQSIGDLTTTRHRVRYTGMVLPPGPVSFSAGLTWDQLGFGLPANTPLPNTLVGVATPLGLTWRISQKWMFLAEISPGIYGNRQDLDWDQFNLPGLAGLSYTVNENLILFLQVSLDPRRDVVVIGGPGLRWRFAPSWTASLLLPRPRIEFQPSQEWLFYAGGELLGGAYRLGKNYGTERGLPEWNRENITYREIRVGVGSLWQPTPSWRVEANVGWSIDRRFVADRLGQLYNGDGALSGLLRVQYSY